MNAWHIRQAARAIRQGGLVAYPTEGVYGLGCDPWDFHAVSRLLRLKGRQAAKGLIVIAASEQQLCPLVDLSDPRLRERAQASWPGPVTWLIPKTAETPGWLAGQHTQLAVRVTAHPIAAQLCRICGPLVSTSANPQGRPPALNAREVRKYFGNSIDYVLPGALGGLRGPTEIRDGRTGRVLRPMLPQ
jgi:L-threonylcarbamoyladenylate synthase